MTLCPLKEVLWVGGVFVCFVFNLYWTLMLDINYFI